MLETVEATAEVFTNHTADKNNPHNVTKEQVGLGNVDNTADIDKPVSNAVNSAINTFKEENSKEHTKIHSAINTFKEESEITFTEINNVIEALLTNIQQAEQLIETLKRDTNTALANKADSNHNHDSTYSKTNHTHTGYAASSHNHDNVYLKSATAASQYAAKSHTHSNYSPTNHTHTGIATTRLNYQNIFTALGITQSLTTQELVTKIGAKQFSFAGTILTGWINSANNIHITDAPADIIHLTITVIDVNGIYLEARAPFSNNSLWIGSVNAGKFGGWKQVLNSTGQAKALEITGTEAGVAWRYCSNIGLTAHYVTPENTGNGNGGAELSEPVLMLSLGSPYNDRKVQLAIGTDTNSLYVRTARTESGGTGYYIYGEWRKI